MFKKIFLLFLIGVFDYSSLGKETEPLPMIISGLGIGICGGILISILIVEKYQLIIYNPLHDITYKWFLSCLVVISLSFWYFLVGENLVLFSNDGPFGFMSKYANQSSIGEGIWNDTQWIGVSGGFKPISLTSIITQILGPIYYSKYYVPIVISFSGICGIIFFRTLDISYPMATIGSIAISLNGNYFSNAAWGVGTRSTVLGFLFLALATINTKRSHWTIRHMLAGLCLGVTIIEGADNGVIMCLLFSAFYFFKILSDKKFI